MPEHTDRTADDAGVAGPATAGPDGGPADPGGALLATLVGFGRALRAAGVTAGPGDVATFCAALGPLDPTDLVDLYWAGRTALVASRADIPVYDEVFRAYFLDVLAPADQPAALLARPAVESSAVLAVPAVDPPGDEEQQQAQLGLVASGAETLRHKSFAACTPDELAALRRIMARMRLTPPRRRTRRTRPARDGHRPDLRRTVRGALRTHGELVDLRRRRRRVKLRPLVLILDVSGSMADYSRALLQFAHTARRAAGERRSRQVEVFCFGTRLTRITPALARRSPDRALAEAAALVADWEGGTRIGGSLEEFVRGWGRRGRCRGAAVVICSDGLDRGDPDVLAAAMQRLSRQCHRIVWLNPHRGDAAVYRPQTVGMMVAQPYIDRLLSGHDLASLEEFAGLLPELG